MEYKLKLFACLALSLSSGIVTGLKVSLEDAYVQIHNGFGTGDVRLQYVTTTEKRFFGNITFHATGENCSVLAILENKSAHNWLLHDRIDIPVCSIANDETNPFMYYLYKDLPNFPRNCPFPNNTVFDFSGYRINEAVFQKYVPRTYLGLRFDCSIICDTQLAFKWFVEVLFDWTEDNKRTRNKRPM